MHYYMPGGLGLCMRMCASFCAPYTSSGSPRVGSSLHAVSAPALHTVTAWVTDGYSLDTYGHSPGYVWWLSCSGGPQHIGCGGGPQHMGLPLAQRGL